MLHRSLLLGALALSLTAPADAATKKPVRKMPTPVVAEVAAPEPEPVRTPGGFMVPRAVTLRTTTPAETEANAVWNMRAALNVAALQCQFSTFLATVKTYNAMLKHHSDELARAQSIMQAHFKRYDGAKGLNGFDQYTTRTYNSYSTLDAQYSFCAAAGTIGREVLATPRGGMGKLALLRNPAIRAALADLPLSPALAVIPMTPLEIPQFEA